MQKHLFLLLLLALIPSTSQASDTIDTQWYLPLDTSQQYTWVHMNGQIETKNQCQCLGAKVIEGKTVYLETSTRISYDGVTISRNENAPPELTTIFVKNSEGDIFVAGSIINNQVRWKNGQLILKGKMELGKEYYLGSGTVSYTNLVWSGTEDVVLQNKKYPRCIVIDQKGYFKDGSIKQATLIFRTYYAKQIGIVKTENISLDFQTGLYSEPFLTGYRE